MCGDFGPDTVISITERGEEGFAARVDFTRRLPAATIFSWLGTLWAISTFRGWARRTGHWLPPARNEGVRS